MRINVEGMVDTILEKNKDLLHPIDVALAGDSDTIYVTDNISNVLASTNLRGMTPHILRKLDNTKETDAEMSVAAPKDGAIILGTDGNPGVYRYSNPDDSAHDKPLLPLCGGVAADPKSARWAAAQPPDSIVVFDGDQVINTLKLPSGIRFYLQGRLSFASRDWLCVAVRKKDDPVGKVWFLLYNIESGDSRELFSWNRERMNDFVVGPRMYWDRKEPKSLPIKR